MIHYPFFGADAHAVGMVILSIALILTVLSGIEYFIRFYRTGIQKSIKNI